MHRPGRRDRLWLVLALAALVAPALACPICGPWNDPKSPLHPLALRIGFAVRAAIDADTLEPLAPDVLASPKSGRRGRMAADPKTAVAFRVARHGRALAEQIVADDGPKAEPFFVVFVDNGHRFRIDPDRTMPAAFSMNPLRPPKEGVATFITADVVLLALIEGRLSLDRALDDGLAVFQGDPERIATVRRRLESSLSAREVRVSVRPEPDRDAATPSP